MNSLQYDVGLGSLPNMTSSLVSPMQEALASAESQTQGKFQRPGEWGFVEETGPVGVKTSLKEASARMGHGRIFADSEVDRDRAKMAFNTVRVCCNYKVLQFDLASGRTTPEAICGDSYENRGLCTESRSLVIQ